MRKTKRTNCWEKRRKTSVVVKKSNDGLERILLGSFKTFSSANAVVKASKVKGAFIRFVPASKEFSLPFCNQPNRRVDVEIVE